jgi:hypothetical protein
MNRARRIGRPVMQDERGLACARCQNALVKLRFLPGRKLFWFILGKPSLHRKIGLWQVQCFFEFQRFGHFYVCPQIRSIGSDAVPYLPYLECCTAVPWLPYLGSGVQPETSESVVIPYVTMIGSRCQRLGRRNLSQFSRIILIQDTLRGPAASKSGGRWCRT